MSFWHTLTDLFLPRYCAVCDVELYATEHVLCNVCLSRMPQVSWRDVEDNPLLRCLWNRYDVEAAVVLCITIHLLTIITSLCILSTEAVLT